jgi:hypothetical protein
MPYFSILMTRDSTESAHVAVEAADAREAYDEARKIVSEADWTLDEENFHGASDIYLGDSDNDIQEIDAETFAKMTAPAPEAAAPEVLKSLLQEAIDAWPQFDRDDGDPEAEVNGGDLVEWFGDFRERVRQALGVTAAKVDPAQDPA